MKKKKKDKGKADFYSENYADMSGYALARLCIGKISVYFMLVIFPLVTPNGWVGITGFRARAFIGFAGLMFAAMLLNEGICFFLCGKKERREREETRENGLWKMDHIKKQIPIILAALFELSVLAAWLFSPYKQDILWGVDAKYVGVLYMTGLAMIYAVVSRCYRFDWLDVKAALAAGALANGLAMLHFLGGNPFGWLDNVVKRQWPIFISTFGNIDVYGVYAVFTTVMAMVVFLKEKDDRRSRRYAALVALNFTGVVVSGTDAAALAILLWLLVIPVFCGKDAKMPERYCQSLLLLTVAGLTVRLLGAAPFFTARKLTGLLSIPTASAVPPAVLAAVFLAGCALCKKHGENIIKWEKRWKKCYLAGLGILLAAFVLVIGVVNVYGKDALFPGSSFLRLDENWGSGRGAIWGRLGRAYGDMPAVNQCFGAGEGSISQVLIDHTPEQTSSIDGKTVVNNAHNIFLHLLITQGMAGLLAWLCLCFRLLRRIIGFYRLSQSAPVVGGPAAWQRRLGEQSVTGILAVGAAAAVCIGQCFFCLIEPIAFPIVFCGMAMANSECSGKFFPKKA